MPVSPFCLPRPRRWSQAAGQPMYKPDRAWQGAAQLPVATECDGGQIRPEEGRMGEASLYETDILAWTEEQAAALRALAGRPDLPNALDLPNVIEEIEALGRTELKAATSPIRLILEHLVKLAADPDAPARLHWIE